MHELPRAKDSDFVAVSGGFGKAYTILSRNYQPCILFKR